MIVNVYSYIVKLYGNTIGAGGAGGAGSGLVALVKNTDMRLTL
jgi:hypothetical protein